jgi:hypothetical protein
VKKQVRSVLLFHHNNRSYQILVILRLFLGACFGFTAQKGDPIKLLSVAAFDKSGIYGTFLQLVFYP